VLGSFAANLLFVGEEKGTEPDAARALAPLLGLTAELPADLSVKRRLQKAQDGNEKPQVHLVGTRLAASARSPYFVEVLVDRTPRKPVVRGGRAYVDLERGDRYAIRLTNNSDQLAAVTLTIDGLGLFAFSSAKGYSYVIVPAKRQVLIRGWHRTNKES